MTQKINNNTPCESLHEVIKYHISSSRTNFYKSFTNLLLKLCTLENQKTYLYTFEFICPYNLEIVHT